MPNVAPGLILILALALSSLAVGSCLRWYSLRGQSGGTARSRRQSLAVWWMLTFAFAAALLQGRTGLALLFCLASLLAVREFHMLFRRRSSDNPLLAWAIALLALAHYWIVAFHSTTQAWLALPVIALVAISSLQIISGRTKDYLRTTAGYSWAALLLVFGLSHVVMFTELPISSSDWNSGVVGWCILVVLLTEMNDIAQALVGRLIGRHKIIPSFSPGKSWEGLAGGVVVTATLSVCLSPWLTTLTEDRSRIGGVLVSVLGGAIISMGGFLGDLNMSGLKREAGVKDSSSLLPGMGGMIDRVDSLTIAAPAFWYYATALN